MYQDERKNLDFKPLGIAIKKSSGSKRVDTGISCPTGRPYATLYYVYYREQGAAPKA